MILNLIDNEVDYDLVENSKYKAYEDMTGEELVARLEYGLQQIRRGEYRTYDEVLDIINRNEKQ